MKTSQLENKANIVVADDQRHVLEALSMLLEGEGYTTISVSEIDSIIPTIKEKPCDLLLMDMNFHRDTTSGQDGLKILGKIKEIETGFPVVVMTAWGSIELAVKAMELGAKDFVEKPWENYRLLSVLKNQLELKREKRRNLRLNAFVSRQYGTLDLIGKSKAMLSVLETVERVASSEASILLTGESGTGKNLIAELIHVNSRVSTGPFVRCNLGTLAPAVFESELFGHTAGSFTDAKNERVGRFAMADEGTIFLDEITNTPYELQAKLLQVIETGEFEPIGSSITQRANVRIVSACNLNLEDEIRGGRFRQDLYFRLNTINIEIPPLRKRREDIKVLAYYFLEKYAKKYCKNIDKLSESALSKLESYNWPGNVRELSHCIEKAVILCADSVIGEHNLGLTEEWSKLSVEEMTLEHAEKYLIGAAMERFDENITTVAKHLGISRGGLYRRLVKYDMAPEKDS